MARNFCHLFALFQRKGWDMKSRYISLRKNPAGSTENKKISYPGKGTRFGKHLFITCLKIEYTLCILKLAVITTFNWSNNVTY